jgi:hypothetical protein
MGQLIFRRLQAAAAAIFLLLAIQLQPASAAQNPPFGSYLLSCRNVQVQSLLGGGTNIVASCRTNDGRYVQSTLPNTCTGDIANINGQLTCTASGPNNTPPSGSYQQSCNNIYMTGPILNANCLRRNGQVSQTTLNVLNCKGGDISNQDGQLTCGGGQVPSGSYQLSCNNAYMLGSVLIAQCRDMSGRMVSTQLNIQGCRQDIANINGSLTCQGQGNRGITVYAKAGWQGESRTIQSAMSDLSTIGFGNSIQSIAISAGTWEFCTGAYFTGRCARLNQGVSDLKPMGWAFQIMSIRPVK